MIRRKVFLALAAVLVLAPLAAIRIQGSAQASAAQPRVVALRGGTVLTATKGTIPNGTVILRDGKIAAVGANVQVPAGAEVIDTTGQFVSPGIIDAHSHIANDAINEGGTTVSSMTGMEDVIDPTDINIYRDLAGGLTVANILHGSANPIGGKNQVIKLRWGKTRAEEIVFEGAMPGIKFALGENPKDMPIGQADRPAPLSDDAHGRRVRHPRRLHARQGVPEGVEGLREEQGQRDRAAAAPRPPARAARRGPRGQAPRARAQLPRRRDPDADPSRRGDGLQDRDLPARARRLHGGEGDRRARRRRLDLLRLVGLQGRGCRRHPAQRRDHDAQGRPRLDQLRQRRARPPPQHRSGKDDEVGRDVRGRSARDGDDQPGEAAAHRQPRRLARSRQGRRRRHLEPPSAQLLRHRRARLHRRHRLLRPQGRRGAADRAQEREVEPRGGRGRHAPGHDQPAGEPARRRRASGRSAWQTTTGRRRREHPARHRPQATQTAKPAAAGAGAVVAITNATIHPITRPTIEKGTIVLRGGEDRSPRRRHPGPRRRDRHRRRRRRRLSRLHQRAHADGPERIWRRAGSKTSTRCSTSIRSCARAWPITPRAMRSPSRGPTASRRSRSCRAAARSAARWR